jgi:hypothetical protein
MAAETKNTAQVLQKIEWNDEQIPSVYANVMAVGITPFDISILLGEVESASASIVKAKPRVKVIVSPEQASLLMQTIGQALAKFIEGSGQLRPVGKQQLDSKNFRFEPQA